MLRGVRDRFPLAVSTVALEQCVQKLARGQILAKTSHDFSQQAHEVSPEQRRQNLQAWVKAMPAVQSPCLTKQLSANPFIANAIAKCPFPSSLDTNILLRLVQPPHEAFANTDNTLLLLNC